MLPKKWQKVALGDLISVKHGWPFKSEFLSEKLLGDPIVVNIGNFQYTGGFRFSSTRVREYRGDYPKDFVLKPNDILLVMTCQTAGGEILGIPGRIPDDGKTYLHNQRMGKVVLNKPKMVSLDYLYWVFLWPEFNQELVASSSGTKILHTAPKRIEAFQLTLPPFAEQQVIARVLKALDDKIELNRRMNHTLEAMAQATFKSWFVDFDPVVAKAEGRRPYGMNAETAALFPSRFEESELGPIPQGWEVSSIANLAKYVNGKNFTKNASGTGRMVIRIAELNSGPGASTVYNEIEANPDNTAYPSDLLFSWSGSLDIYRWHQDEALVNQHIFKVIPDGFPQWFVYFQLREAISFFQGIAADKATTMGHIKREHLFQAKMALPMPELIDAMDYVVGPLYDRIHQNERESLILVTTRDTLLPKLLSGEIRVSQAERIAEEVV